MLHDYHVSIPAAGAAVRNDTRRNGSYRRPFGDRDINSVMVSEHAVNRIVP